jgi:hypothetical protein
MDTSSGRKPVGDEEAFDRVLDEKADHLSHVEDPKLDQEGPNPLSVDEQKRTM